MPITVQEISSTKTDELIHVVPPPGNQTKFHIMQVVGASVADLMTFINYGNNTYKPLYMKRKDVRKDVTKVEILFADIMDNTTKDPFFQCGEKEITFTSLQKCVEIKFEQVGRLRPH